MNSEDDNSILIGLAGDVMIGRNVNDQIVKKDYRYPWGNVLSMLRSTDLNVVNLETALTVSDEVVFKTFNFKTKPEHVAVLSEARIDVVNLANNHVFDFGRTGFIETIEVLRNHGISYVGAGMNIDEAAKPWIFSVNKLQVAFLGFTDNESGWAATENSPGTNYIDIGNIEKFKKAIDEIKIDADLLIVTIHWGPNMHEQPYPAFIRFAHQMVDCGVDIIHGHSAHIFQGIEWYKEKLILYDTGDFIDDYRVDPFLRNDLSFLFLCKAAKKEIKSLQLIPVRISGMQVNLATGVDHDFCIRRIQKLSTPFGTKVLETGEVSH